MSLKVIRPRWEPVSSATGSTGMRPAPEGRILLEFAHSRGEREYDWASKEVGQALRCAAQSCSRLRQCCAHPGVPAPSQTFSLSATECAELLEAMERREQRSLFHDPNKMREGEGVIRRATQGRWRGRAARRLPLPAALAAALHSLVGCLLVGFLPYACVPSAPRHAAAPSSPQQVVLPVGHAQGRLLLQPVHQKRGLWRGRGFQVQHTAEQR